MPMNGVRRGRWMRGAWSVAAFTAALAGCETIESLTAGIEKPTAAIQRVGLGELSAQHVDLVFDIEVSNPYSVALPLANVDYGLASGGRSFLSGAAPLDGSVPARGTKVVTLPARVSLPETLSVLRDVRPGAVVPYTADLTLAVDAPGVGEVSIPLRKEAELPVPTVPGVSLEGLAWERLSLDEATARLSLRVVNENDFPLDLKKLDYGLSLAGQPVGRAGVRESASFEAGQGRAIDIPISFSPSGLGLAFLNMLRGDGAEYDLAGTMKFDSPFGPVDLPYTSQGRVPFTR